MRGRGTQGISWEVKQTSGGREGQREHANTRRWGRRETFPPETAEHTELRSGLRRAFPASQAYSLYSESKLCDQVLSTGRRAGPASGALS